VDVRLGWARGVERGVLGDFIWVSEEYSEGVFFEGRDEFGRGEICIYRPGLPTPHCCMIPLFFFHPLLHLNAWSDGEVEGMYE